MKLTRLDMNRVLMSKMLNTKAAQYPFEDIARIPQNN